MKSTKLKVNGLPVYGELYGNLLAHLFQLFFLTRIFGRGMLQSSPHLKITVQYPSV